MLRRVERESQAKPGVGGDRGAQISIASQRCTPEFASVFLRGFRDLVKGPWVKILEELKLSGGLPVPELQRRLGGSYMGIKDQCEALRERGFVETWRVPRKEVGRPEIMYRLGPKADGLFPEAGTEMTLGILESAHQVFGASAPERLLLVYFQNLQAAWQPRMNRAKSLVEKATILTSLRDKIGCFSRCKYDADRGFRIEEFHHPFQAIYEAYPNAIQFELRMMEELLGSKVMRREFPGGRGGPARIDYEVATLGVRE